MPKPPSWNEIRVGAQAFAARWADDKDERSGAQAFWLEFLQIFGVDVKRVATFEARARRTSTGGRGRIDLFWPGVLVAEHKSAGRNLADAEDQALDYLDSIDQRDFPGVVITSNFGHLRVLDLGGDRQPFEFSLRDLPKEIDRFGFIAGYKQRKFGAAEEEQANIDAARLMARLYEQLSKTGYEGHDASVLLTRLLFLMFGDDTGMWEKSLFTEFVETRTQPDGSDVGPQLAMLFQNLDREEKKRPSTLDDLIARFPYINGGLFRGQIDIPAFDRQMRDELVACCSFDWGAISPAIFGSMFQAVKSRDARRVLGEHYTTEINILKAIRPLFLDDLRAEFEASRNNASRLRRLRDRLSTLRYMDPACGCGNFLVVAYREMRLLELDILKRLRDLSPHESQLSLDPTLGLRVSLDQFYGIEIEEWPKRIAETAMFLVDHQCNLALAQEFGQAPDRLPIEIAATIRNDNAIRFDWNDMLPAGKCTYIFGNPPFVGMHKMTPEQQEDNRRAFTGIRGGSRTGRLDYVACWYAQVIRYSQGHDHIRTALVSTNSLVQGEQARSMGPMLATNGLAIDFAHRAFSWTSEAPEAAVVTVVILGFSRGGLASVKHLYEYPSRRSQPNALTAKHINIYLADSDVAAIAKHTVPLVAGIPKMTKGSQPTDGGHLIVEAEDYDEVMADARAAKYVRRLIGAQTVLHGEARWCLWLVNADPRDLAHSPVLRRRLDGVVQARRSSKTRSVQLQAKTPALFTQIRQPGEQWLWVPRHSSENRDVIPMAFFGPEDIAHDSTLLIAGADLYLFGLLQSRMFTSWARAVSGGLESRIRISPDLSYNSFPFPQDVKPLQLERVADAARGVLQCRDEFPGATLADLYDTDSTPLQLVDAHRRLDKTVDLLFGRRTSPSEAERQALLFAAYERLSAPLRTVG